MTSWFDGVFLFMFVPMRLFKFACSHKRYHTIVTINILIMIENIEQSFRLLFFLAQRFFRHTFRDMTFSISLLLCLACFVFLFCEFCLFTHFFAFDRFVSFSTMYIINRALCFLVHALKLPIFC